MTTVSGDDVEEFSRSVPADAPYIPARVSLSEFYRKDKDMNEQTKDRIKIASDGGSTDYWKIPTHATDVMHLISHVGMSKCRGDIFKACYRLGLKEGVDVQYDLNKMKFFIDELIEMNKRGEML